MSIWRIHDRLFGLTFFFEDDNANLLRPAIMALPVLAGVELVARFLQLAALTNAAASGVDLLVVGLVMHSSRVRAQLAVDDAGVIRQDRLLSAGLSATFASRTVSLILLLLL